MVERPVECSHCKKPVKVIYKEIVDQSVVCTEMCADCPILQHKLHGGAHAAKTEAWKEGDAGLCCGNCHTSLESLKTANPLGCSECYTVFEDFLISELIATDRIPPHLRKQLLTKKNQSIHIGKTPAHPVTLPPSSRLATLNEALNEALKRENYEQAAWLRDQIKALEGKADEK